MDPAGFIKERVGLFKDFTAGRIKQLVDGSVALRAIQEEAQSDLPALGYTVPYAIGNIVLTAWGPVLVAMMS